MKKKVLFIILGIVGLLGVTLGVLFAKASTKTPSNSREWSADQAVLPFVDFGRDSITIHNVRSFNYSSATEYEPEYRERTLKLEDIESVWYVVTPFANWRGPAHTLLSFGLKNGEYIAVSVEIRKEQGEEFTPLRGLFNEYEIMYVIADEDDVVKLRTNYRKNEEVFVYPIKTSPDRAQRLFVAILERVNELVVQPEFYNTVTNNCTSNIVDHVNHLVPGRIAKSWQAVFPGYSDKLAYDLGLFDTELSWEQVREYYNVSQRAQAAGDEGDYSAIIRDFEN